MDIGVDIEQVERFAFGSTHAFVLQHFSAEEIGYAFAHTIPAQHLCGMFCAKEAVRKVLAVPLRQITVSHEADGRPIALIDGKVQQIRISISHTAEYAVAVALRTGP